MPKQSYFTPKLFKFLKELKANNEKPWFEKNKERYLAEVREPFLQFIADFAPRLRAINPHFVADPRPVGGSFFRIYRDVRFSKDKAPYKTHAAAKFNHELGKDVHAPGFYLHLEPGQIFGGGGIWKPDPTATRKIRAAIAEDSAKFKRILNAKSFKKHCTIIGDQLVRAPKGFDPDDPMIEYLRYKDFLITSNFTQKQVCSAEFMDLWVNTIKTYMPYTTFLCESIGLPV